MTKLFDELIWCIRHSVSGASSVDKRFCMQEHLMVNCQMEINEHVKKLNFKDRLNIYKYYLSELDETDKRIGDYRFIDKSKLHSGDDVYEEEDLQNLLSYTNWFREWLTKSINPVLPPSRKPLEEFESIFINPDDANRVISIFKKFGYVNSDDKWIGVSGKPYELRNAYYVLKPIIDPELEPTTAITILYVRFGMSVNATKKRSFTRPPNSKKLTEFERIFSDLLKKI